MRKLTVLLTAAALVSLCSLASAQQFFDDFESYTAGSSLHGQGGWKGWDDAAGATGYVSTKYAYSGKNSVEIVPASDLVHEFSAKGGLWRFSAMQYIPTGSTGIQYFILLNQYYTARDWSIQTQYTGDSGAITAQLPTNSGKTILYDTWVKIEFIIDLDNNSYEEYYDGVKIAGGQWDDNAHGTLEAIDLFGNNASAIYYDDISLRVYRNSTPSDGQTNVARDAAFSWTATGSDITYDVYLGTSRDDVSKATRTNPLGVLVGEGQATATYQPAEPLEFGKTYYWRADEVGEITLTGEVWSFTVEPYLYPITAITATASSAQPDMEPQDLVNGVGLNDADEHSVEAADMWMTTGTDPKPDWVKFEFDQPYKLSEMWVWNSNQMIETLVGFGAKSVTIEYSADGQTWTTLENAPEFAQAPGQTTYTANTQVSFGGVTAKFVKLSINSTWGGVAPQTGLAEVRFYYVPVNAFEPDPADEATGVDIDSELSWRPGREATSHKVYIGTDAEAVANGAVNAATVTDNSYTPEALDLTTTYYWKVDETGDAGTYAGNVWSFTTSDYDVIDDFESYDDSGNRIYQGWVDGVTDEGSGSQVGYDESPFAEQTLVHGGKQAMPLIYSNTDFAFSEATRTFDSGQDWTASGIKSLSLWFRGATGNTGTLYIKLNNTKVPYEGPASDIGIGGWQRWDIDLSTAGNVSSVRSLTIGIEGSGATGILYIDDIRLYPKVFASSTSNVDIAISAQANWWSQAAANREIQEIVDNVKASVVVFNTSDQSGLADWLSSHTSDGVADLLILCGQLPDTIYASGNTQVNDSIVEKFLDGGNTIINTGDWIFYVVNNAGTNGEAGLQTIMDIPDVTVAGGDDTAVTVTAEGQELTPSLQNFATDRPFHLDTLAGDWSTELVLAQTADGALADPVVVRNSATGGRIGVFYQAASEDNLPRGEVITEWINNWYLDAVSGGN